MNEKILARSNLNRGVENKSVQFASLWGRLCFGVNLQSNFGMFVCVCGGCGMFPSFWVGFVRVCSLFFLFFQRRVNFSVGGGWWVVVGSNQLLRTTTDRRVKRISNGIVFTNNTEHNATSFSNKKL